MHDVSLTAVHIMTIGLWRFRIRPLRTPLDTRCHLLRWGLRFPEYRGLIDGLSVPALAEDEHAVELRVGVVNENDRCHRIQAKELDKSLKSA